MSLQDWLLQFNFFKVEIVGDGYLVASGLPKPNGDLHASEISRMALQLMSLVASFEVIYHSTAS